MEDSCPWLRLIVPGPVDNRCLVFDAADIDKPDRKPKRIIESGHGKLKPKHSFSSNRERIASVNGAVRKGKHDWSVLMPKVEKLLLETDMQMTQIADEIGVSVRTLRWMIHYGEQGRRAKAILNRRNGGKAQCQ